MSKLAVAECSGAPQEWGWITSEKFMNITKKKKKKECT
jgi:hypothetical protein